MKDLRAGRAPGGGQGHLDVNLALGDLHIVHETQVHDVDPQLRILDLAQGLPDRIGVGRGLLRRGRLFFD